MLLHLDYTALGASNTCRFHYSLGKSIGTWCSLVQNSHKLKYAQRQMNTFGCLTFWEHHFIRIHKGIGHNFQPTDLCLSVTGNTDQKKILRSLPVFHIITDTFFHKYLVTWNFNKTRFLQMKLDYLWI